MCGIVGAVAKRDISSVLLTGLQRLEYRGYDSAGIAIINGEHGIQRLRRRGKVSQLAELLAQETIPGETGIAHTRWATHGAPTETNAHPILSRESDIAVVHNGIIENHHLIHAELVTAGFTFTSQTDSEVIVHLFELYLQQGCTLLQAAQKLANRLTGAFAIGIIQSRYPDRLIAIRQGCPLVIGIGKNENFVASDQLALLPVTQNFIYLHDGDLAEIYHDHYTIYDKQGNSVSRDVHTSSLVADETSKGHYRHFMKKEIHEQPEAFNQLLEGRLSDSQVLMQIFGDKAESILSQVKRVQIIACGTSYHAGLVARYWLEGLANIPCQVEVASEYRYRQTVTEPNTLFVTLSQSGETADTLAALQRARQLGFLATLAICNVPESAIVRGSDLTLMMRAGVEIGVASTKAFSSQLGALLLLTTVLARNNKEDKAKEAYIVRQLRALPNLLNEVLTLDGEIKQLATLFVDKRHALFLGRGIHYPIALEGALKLKEISYIHAEAYPAGELKHGPLALVDEDMPVVAVAPNDALLDKLASNLEEVKARGGKLIVFADKETQLTKKAEGVVSLPIPTVDDIIAPIVYTIPLQLLAYHVAVLKGTDVDQPRNLAKSVTVE